MKQISNRTLALLVVAALAVVVVTTGVQLSEFNKLTGQATTNYDTGDVTITVADSLNIEVDATNNSIDFGTCTPIASIAHIDSNNGTSNTTVCDGQAASGLDHIRVNNIGNLDANVTVEAEAACSLTTFLPEVAGTTNNLRFFVDGPGCAEGAMTKWTAYPEAAATACQNITIGSYVKMWARLTLDSDATAAGCGGVNSMNFNATATL